MVRGTWVKASPAMGEGFARKDHQSHAVVLAPVDKFSGHFLGCFQPVGLEVLGQHTAAHVHGKDNVYAFHFHLLSAEHTLWTCESNDEGSHCHHAQDEKQRVGALAKGLVHASEQADVGELQGGFLFAVAQHIPHRHQRDYKQQQ